MKKHKKFLISILVFGILIASLEINVASSFHGEVSKVNMKEWTIMLYDDADFYRAYDPLDDFSKEAYSSQYVNVLVLQDEKRGGAKLWYIDENHEKQLLEEMGELNMGNYTTLRDFIIEAKTDFPASRYILFLYNHGGGWKGACWDDTDDDWLTMDEIRRALVEAGGVNIIGFTAPCLMGCIEGAYELRECVEVYIGSEEMSGYSLWFNSINQLCNLLNEKPNISTLELGKEIVNMIKENNPYFGTIEDYIYRIIMFLTGRIFYLYPPEKTISAVRTDKLNELIIEIDKFSQHLIEILDEKERDIMFARNFAEDFPRPMLPLSIRGELVDVYSFAELAEKFGLADTKYIREVLNQTIIAEYHQVGHWRAHGLSLYFPPKNSIYIYDESYAQCNLDFTEDTHWDEFLTAYLNR